MDRDIVPNVVFTREVDRQIELMKKQLISTRDSLLKKGIPESNIVYIKRNGPNDENPDDTVGIWFYKFHEIVESLNAERELFKYMPDKIEDGKPTVYDCLAINGMDLKLFEKKLREGIKNNIDAWEMHEDAVYHYTIKQKRESLL
jgi:hypothetical protein